MRKNSGITLIALVVTIIVLIILAGISINLLFGQNGIIKKAEQGAKIYGDEEKKEFLSLMYQEYLIDKASLGKNITYLEYLDEKGYEIDYYDEQLKDGTVIIDTKKFEVQTSSELKINYIGEASQDELNKPKFTSVSAVVEDTSVQITALLKDSQGVTLTYSIKKELDLNNGTEQSSSTFSNLEQGTIYIVTVKAVNEYGEKVKKLTIRTKGLAELTEGKANFVLSANTRWQSSINVTISTTFSGDENIKLQYRIGEEGNYIDYPIGGFVLRENCNLYGRYYDTISNEEGYKFTVENIDIIDSIAPNDAQILLSATSVDVGQTITAGVTHLDEQTQIVIASCKYIINTSSDLIGKDAEAWNTATAFSSNPQNISITKSAGGTYYLHVLSIDEAGNKKESVSSSFRFKAVSTLISWSGGRIVSGAGRFQIQNNYGPQARIQATMSTPAYCVSSTPIDVSEIEEIYTNAVYYAKNGSGVSGYLRLGIGKNYNDLNMDVYVTQDIPWKGVDSNLRINLASYNNLEGTYYVKLILVVTGVPGGISAESCNCYCNDTSIIYIK